MVFFASELKDKILWKSVPVSFYLFVEPPCHYARLE
jgi:hypothetical protein